MTDVFQAASSGHDFTVKLAPPPVAVVLSSAVGFTAWMQYRCQYPLFVADNVTTPSAAVVAVMPAESSAVKPAGRTMLILAESTSVQTLSIAHTDA